MSSATTRIAGREYWIGASRREGPSSGFLGLKWYVYDGHALQLWAGISGLLVLSFWTFRFR